MSRVSAAAIAVVRWFDSSAGRFQVAKDAPNKVDWARCLPFIGLHVACLSVFLVGVSWAAAIACLGLYAVRMFFITGFYHRYFSHRAFKAPRPVQFLMGVAGNTAVQRGPLWWAAHHRHHHAHSDQPGDAHSPIQHSFWWAHMGWITDRKHFATDYDAVSDLAKFPELRFLDRFDSLVPIAFAVSIFLVGFFFGPALGTSGLQLFVWGFVVSTVLLFHGTCTINSLSHLIGKRRYQTTDHSRNSWLLAIITLGEGWHNNHHYYQVSARQGFYWWEYDVTFYLLKLMSLLGLVRELKPVPARVREGGRIQPR